MCITKGIIKFILSGVITYNLRSSKMSNFSFDFAGNLRVQKPNIEQTNQERKRVYNNFARVSTGLGVNFVFYPFYSLHLLFHNLRQHPCFTSTPPPPQYSPSPATRTGRSQEILIARHPLPLTKFSPLPILFTDRRTSIDASVIVPVTVSDKPPPLC